jgi:glutamine synthetase
MAGTPRGKIMPAHKFGREEGVRLPESLFLQTVTGEYPEDLSAIHPAEIDMLLVPDIDTVRVVPWATDATAQVIHDCVHHDGSPVDIAPRYVLRKVLKLYEDRGWQPLIAPELEFFLVSKNTDPDYPLEPPVGRSGRQETARQSYGIDAVNEFDPFFDDIYDYCEAQTLEIDTLIHEAGAAQMEINFLHGEALDRADQAFLFKRTVRETALRHDMYATFMAKPLSGEPGSAMHIHQSVQDRATGDNIFSDQDGEPSELFLNHIGGLQKYLPAAMSFFAPNVNSYRRIARHHSAPINLKWGYDNRTVGFRVPISSPQARRVENRVAGSDVNPYLAVAASLACGYLGMTEGVKPGEPCEGSAYDLPYGLPRNMDQSLALLEECDPLQEVLGEKFIRAYRAIKEREYDTYFEVISSWEREFLLLNV